MCLRGLLDQGWANFLTRGPQWVLKYNRGAGPGADGWIVLVTHLTGEKKYNMEYFENVL